MIDVIDFSSWNIYADIHNFEALFEDTTLEESWALSFSAGTEIVIFKTISLLKNTFLICRLV